MPLRPGTGLRDYQAAAVQKAIDAGCGTVRIATGGGKTRVGAAVIATLERPAIFLVHRRDLLHQAIDVLRELFHYPEVIGQVGDGVYEPNLVTVATVQSVAAALGIGREKDDEDKEERPPHAALETITEMLERCEVLIVDEAHHVPADTIFEILGHMNTIYRIGLSATDWRDDGADMMIEAALGPRCVDISLTNLIDWGYLVPAKITMHKAAGCDGPPVDGKWNTVYKHYIAGNELFAEQVIGQAGEWHEQGRTILTLVTAVAHGKRLAHDMNLAGIRTEFLSGEDDSVQRRTVLEALRRKELRSLIATSIADEGLDLPSLDALILAGGGKSSTKTYQRIGRILRPFPGKTEGLVADYRVRRNKWLDEHAKDRLRIYRTEAGFHLRDLS
jgi:superfamily II DNA or RNA helicase